MTEPAPEVQWGVELDSRRRGFRQVLDGAGCDAGLVFGCDGHAQHFRYLTNFTPVLGDSWLLLAGELACFLTFPWQIVEAIGRSGIERWDAAINPIPLVVEALRQARPKRLGVAGVERMPAPAWRALMEGLPGVDLVDVGAGLAKLRRRKSPLEVDRLRAAARLTDSMLDAGRAGVHAGVSESVLAARLSTLALESGGACAFATTVVSGTEHPVPIRMPSTRRFEPGDTVMIDLGAEVDGYQADASRTFVLGRPSLPQRKAWDVVLAAYEAAVALARPGVPCRDLHRAASGIIEAAGYKVAHRAGHGIGLATSYEWPSLDTEEAPLEPGVTICIEPGVYFPGAGNMKLEDDFLITESGCEALTTSERGLELTL
ncbi:aminopeptidase P family protein [bacterium]|nr:MAG: aminopeptidase P family protein [bacterium]